MIGDTAAGEYRPFLLEREGILPTLVLYMSGEGVVGGREAGARKDRA
jgi:hypothetical protein